MQWLLLASANVLGPFFGIKAKNAHGTDNGGKHGNWGGIEISAYRLAHCNQH
jgi:hypothetical protein